MGKVGEWGKISTNLQNPPKLNEDRMFFFFFILPKKNTPQPIKLNGGIERDFILIIIEYFY